MKTHYTYATTRMSLVLICFVLTMICTSIGAAAQCTLTDSIVQPVCSGGTTGQVFLRASGGTLPYTYRLGINGTWQSSSAFTGLQNGRDTFYLSDAAGCSSNTIAVLSGPAFAHMVTGYTDLGGGLYTFSAYVPGFTSPSYIWEIDGHFGSNDTTLLAPGRRIINVMISEGGCSAYDSIVIIVPALTAGTDRTICQYQQTVMNATGSGTWSADPGNPAIANIISPTSPTTVISGFTASGAYTFIWTDSSSIDAVQVAVSARPNAGPDRTVAVGGTVSMLATGTGTWSAHPANPGSVTIIAPSSPTTGITGFTVASGYRFIWTSSAGCSDTVSVAVGGCNIIITDTITAPGCSYNSGLVRLGATGGTAPYQYRNGINGTWQVGSAFTGLTAGTDTFYVLDVNNCLQSLIRTITRTGSYPSVAPTSNSPVSLGGTISLVAHPTGTVSTYSWTGPNSFTSSTANPSITGATAASGGTYHITVANSTGCNAHGQVTVVVTGNGAGPDQTVACASLPGGIATMAAIGTGTWSAAAGNPGIATITSPSSISTTITSFGAAGTYRFLFTSAGLADTALVTVTAKPNAGADKAVTVTSLPGGSATMGATGTGVWTTITGNPGTATISSSTTATTTIINYSAAGTYLFKWTNGSGCTDTVAVVVNLGSAFSAGTDAALCSILPGGSVTMAGTGAGTWTAAAGNPGTAIITTPTSPATTITDFSAAGLYRFVWTAGSLRDTAAITVTTLPYAGPSRTVSCATFPGGAASMLATGSGIWSAVGSNPGTATIMTLTDPNTVITNYSTAGTYRFLWVNSVGCASPVVVTVTGRPDAGADKTAIVGGTATMAASGTGTWSIIPGNPGTASITTASDPVTTIAAFSTTGTYLFKWTNATGCADTAAIAVTLTACPFTVTDTVLQPSCLVNSGSVSIGVQGGTQPFSYRKGVNGTWQSDHRFAGLLGERDTFYIMDASSCVRSITEIITPSATQINAFPSSNSPVVPGGTVNFVANGAGPIYAYSWTGPNGFTSTAANPSILNATTNATGWYSLTCYAPLGCTVQKALFIQISADNAGPDRTLSCASIPGGYVFMAGSGAGIWSALAGNPGTATITSPASPTTTIAGFTSAGVYRFIFTSGSAIDTASVTVTARPNAGPDRSTSIAGSVTMAASGTGSWQFISGPGTASIALPGLATTTISGFTAAGSYYYSWTAGSCSDTAIVVVSGPCGLTGSIAVVPYSPDSVRLVTSISGGTGSYRYDWSQYVQDNMAYNTAYVSNNGIYQVTVTDRNSGCQVVLTDTVSSLPCSIQADLSYTHVGAQYHFDVAYTGVAHPVFKWRIINFTQTDYTTSVPFLDASIAIGQYDVGVTCYVRDSGTTCMFADSVGFTANVGGPDMALNCISLPGGSVIMAASPASGLWTAIPGNPGTCTIATPSFANTTINTFSAAGTYYFLWATAAQSDTVAVTVSARANGGSDRAITIGTTAVMGATGTGIWTHRSPNPSSTTINSAGTPTATISGFSVPGNYYYIWTTTAGCTDTAIVVVSAAGPVDAGPDRNVSCVTLPGGAVTMAGSGAGTWTALSGNPGTANIIIPSSAVTAITGFSAAGTYGFIRTSGLVSDTALIIVSAAANAGPDRTATCITSLPGGIATMAATGTGIWTVLAANPGTASISSPSSPTTTIGSFTVAGTYRFLWTATGGCADTATVSVSASGIVPVLASVGGSCIGDTLVVHAPSGTISIQWQSNSSVVHTSSERDSFYVPLTAGVYTAYIADIGGCHSTASNAITISACLSDSVWPGDADHDGLADNNDLLPIGTAYGLNGFPRPDQSIVWSAHYAQDWGVQFLNGTNTKHADCNGSGLIDANDTTAIMQNFGLTHSKTGGYGAPWRAGSPALTVDFTKDTLVSGDTLTVGLILGDSILTVADIYGLAFTYHYDHIVTDSTSTSFAFLNSFLGNATDKISIHKIFSNGTVKAAVTGINHLNRNGHGKIAQFRCIITTDNINGKDLSYYNSVHYITDIKAIDKDENVIDINEGVDSNRVAFEPTGIREAPAVSVQVYPNPATDRIQVITEANMTEVTITNVLGQQVVSLNLSGKKSETIDVSHLPAAIYTIHVSTARGSGTSKLVMTR